jgi:hypothetical protein
MNEISHTFAQCPRCLTSWSDRPHFLQDCQFDLIGYHADYENPRAGLFHFCHKASQCGEVFSLPVDLFWTLLDDPGFTKLLESDPTCPHLCDQPACLEACRKACLMAHTRYLAATLATVKNPALSAPASPSSSDWHPPKPGG